MTIARLNDIFHNFHPIDTDFTWAL